MEDSNLLERIYETANDEDLKVTAIRDRIRSLFEETEFDLSEEVDADTSDEFEGA